MIEQTMIAIFGVTAVWLTQQGRQEWKRYACVLGLIGQPFWFYATFKAEQWGIFALSFCYTYSWGLGFWNNWVSPWRRAAYVRKVARSVPFPR